MCNLGSLNWLDVNDYQSVAFLMLCFFIHSHSTVFLNLLLLIPSYNEIK